MASYPQAEVYVKNNSAFNPRLRHVKVSDVDRTNRSLDVPINITGFIIRMVIIDSNGTVIDTFTTQDNSIKITNASDGEFYPLKADTSSWVAGQTYLTDVKLTDVNGDGLNDATITMQIHVMKGIS
jgi:hypothetical protein